MNPTTVDQYNYDINNPSEKNDAAVNEIEDNLNSSADIPKTPSTESTIITGEKQDQTSSNDVSSISTTAVNIMNDESRSVNLAI